VVSRIRVLYFDGCPHFEGTLDLVRTIAGEAAVDVLEVGDERDAAQLRFFGSPTVQVDGVDIEPSARGRTDFTLGCRLYGASGLPPKRMIVDAIRGLET